MESNSSQNWATKVRSFVFVDVVFVDVLYMYVLYVLRCALIRKECENAFVLGHEKLCGCAETLRKLIQIIPDHYQVLRVCTASYDLWHSVDRETTQDATAVPRATSPTTCQGKRSSKTPTLQQRS